MGRNSQIPVNSKQLSVISIRVGREIVRLFFIPITWEIITTIKHPVMAGREADVENALRNPDEIRVSKRDEQVYLFYKSERVERWVCAVTKRLNGEGFLITTYPTDAIKEGERIWPR